MSFHKYGLLVLIALTDSVYSQELHPAEEVLGCRVNLDALGKKIVQLGPKRSKKRIRSLVDETFPFSFLPSTVRSAKSTTQGGMSGYPTGGFAESGEFLLKSPSLNIRASAVVDIFRKQYERDRKAFLQFSFTEFMLESSRALDESPESFDRVPMTPASERLAKINKNDPDLANHFRVADKPAHSELMEFLDSVNWDKVVPFRSQLAEVEELSSEKLTPFLVRLTEFKDGLETEDEKYAFRLLSKPLLKRWMNRVFLASLIDAFNEKNFLSWQPREEVEIYVVDDFAFVLNLNRASPSVVVSIFEPIRLRKYLKKSKSKLTKEERAKQVASTSKPARPSRSKPEPKVKFKVKIEDPNVLPRVKVRIEQMSIETKAQEDFLRNAAALLSLVASPEVLKGKKIWSQIRSLLQREAKLTDKMKALEDWIIFYEEKAAQEEIVVEEPAQIGSTPSLEDNETNLVHLSGDSQLDELSANQLYAFRFDRPSPLYEGPQNVIFSEDALSFFQSGPVGRKFYESFLLGFARKHRQNGIKPIKRWDDPDNDHWEVKVIGSATRIPVVREGQNIWKLNSPLSEFRMQ